MCFSNKYLSLQHSIFKSGHLKQDKDHLPSTSKSEYYDGMGGSSKEDIYPVPKPFKVSSKRPKSSSSGSHKMKKLAPLNTKCKINDFFSEPL